MGWHLAGGPGWWIAIQAEGPTGVPEAPLPSFNPPGGGDEGLTFNVSLICRGAGTQSNPRAGRENQTVILFLFAASGLDLGSGRSSSPRHGHTHSDTPAMPSTEVLQHLPELHLHRLPSFSRQPLPLDVILQLQGFQLRGISLTSPFYQIPLLRPMVRFLLP